MSKYSKEELDNILHKEVEIVLGDIDDDDVFSFKGKMISYNTDSENVDMPADFVFHTLHGAIKTFKFVNLKEIRVL